MHSTRKDLQLFKPERGVELIAEVIHALVLQKGDTRECTHALRFFRAGISYLPCRSNALMMPWTSIKLLPMHFPSWSPCCKSLFLAANLKFWRSFQTTHTTLQKFACSLLAGIANETEEGATSIVIDGGRQIIERAKRQHANKEQVRTPADLIATRCDRRSRRDRSLSHAAVDARKSSFVERIVSDRNTSITRRFVSSSRVVPMRMRKKLFL